MSEDEDMAVVPSADGSRLVIKEMVLENFKSYAGEQRVGPFHKNFSSVVGPNGSGKSNVIDAMLFVFGKRAKQLRLNKVSELIHNSTHHQDVPMARVSVHFIEIIDKGDNEFDVVPGSDLVVARTAHRDNKSDYYVDGRKSSFGAVTTLLKGKGIDLDNNRFLILQGEVEQISLMKPKGADKNDTGLLEYLEDIIGTDKYVDAIEEQGKRLEELSDSLNGLRQRAKVAEDERDRLEGPKEVALAYQAKERELLVKEAAIYRIFVYDGQKTLLKLDSNVAALEERLQYERQKLANYSKDLQQAEARFKESEQMRAADQAELDAAAAEIAEFERRDVKFKEDRRHCKAKLKKAEEKLAKDAARLQELEAEAQKLERDIPAIGTKSERLSAELSKQEEVLEGLREGVKGEVEALTRQLQGVRAQLAPWEARIAAAQSAADVAASERDLLQQQQEAAQKRLKEAEDGRTAASEAASAKDGDVLRMEKQMKLLRGEAELAREQQTAAAAEAERLQASVYEVRGRVEQRRGEASSRRSAGAIVDALVAERQAGRLPGVHGRLGDLGAIDATYDVAVSSAVPALDYIVVDTTVTAQKCVELLRRQKLGVATFLILEKQQQLAAQMRQSAAPPEGALRLFDLVKVREPALGAAFYYAMRDTVVAKDLDQASRIAYGADKRWAKVVTLKGELINESGTMTGGGARQRSGRMCLGSQAPRRQDDREAATELATAEKELAAGAKALEKARADATEAGAALKAAERQLAELETAALRARMEAGSLRARAQDLADRLAQLRAATKLSAEDSQRIEVLTAELAAAEKELAGLRKSASGLQSKADKLVAAIEGAGGEEMRNQRALVDQLQKDIAAKDAEKARAEVQAAAATKASDKLRKEGVKGEAERQRLSVELEELKAIFQELEELALKVMATQQETQARLEARREEMAAVVSEFERKKKEVNSIRSVEVEIENATKDQKDTRRNEEKKLRHWQKEVVRKREQIADAFAEGEAPSELTEEELDAMDTEKAATDTQYEVTMLTEELKVASPDLDAIERWRVKEAECARRGAELETVRTEREGVRRRHDELRKSRLDGFMAGFNSISLKLKEMYQMITLGGDAELELVDSLDPFSEGIVFSVRPPKKSWKNIANLSGGEKTLSSLSLVFALHHYKPTPLYVMDEIDAALDFKNVSIVAHYIKERTKDAQFIIISLRNNMFELADRLVGIYKTDNATKSLAINPGEFVIGRMKGALSSGTNTAASDQEQRRPALAAS